MLFLEKFDVFGTTTTVVPASFGTPLFNDKEKYTIIHLSGDLPQSTLLRQRYKVNKAAITVSATVAAYIRVALYGDRDGHLNDYLSDQGWELLDGWYVEWYENAPTKLDRIWSKHLAAGQSISFISNKDDMTFAIFASEGKTFYKPLIRHGTMWLDIRN